MRQRAALVGGEERRFSRKTPGKFKRMRYELKKWRKSISKLSLCIENCNKALFRLDQLEDMRGLTVPESNFRKILKKHLLCLLDYQQQYWKKRCTVRWTKFGDENTKKFKQWPQKDTEGIPLLSCHCPMELYSLSIRTRNS
jgi:hypothetical protein